MPAGVGRRFDTSEVYKIGLLTGGPTHTNHFLWMEMLAKEDRATANLLANRLGRPPFAPRAALESVDSLHYLNSSTGGEGGWEASAPRLQNTLTAHHKLATCETVRSWGSDSSVGEQLKRSCSLPALERSLSMGSAHSSPMLQRAGRSGILLSPPRTARSSSLGSSSPSLRSLHRASGSLPPLESPSARRPSRS